MRIVDFLRPDLVIPRLDARDKPGVLREITRTIATRLGNGVDATALDRVLAEREKLASTAIGEGVAIPHGKLAGVTRLSACIARSVDGVEFDSMDGRPTHIFIALVAPEASTGEHLKALARISRLFKDPDFRTRILQAPDADGIYRVVADEDAKYTP